MSLASKLEKLFSIKRKKELIPVIKEIPSDKLLEGRVALVSGATGGIGSAIAESLVLSGAKVIVGGTKREKTEKLTEKLNEFSKGCARGLIFDISKIEEYDILIKEALDCFGKIDIFVNSAGVHTENAILDCITSQEFDRVIGINLKGPYLFSIKLYNYMKNNGIKGHMLFVSSTRGFEPAWSPYGISKWGLNGMVEGLASLFIHDGIIVNGIAPGSTATDLIGFKEGNSVFTDDNLVNRFALPSEIANVAKMLVADTGNMIIGETIRVSGGRGIIDIRS